MTNVKWIKLNVNVFDDEKFDAIRTLPDSNDLQLAWVKLLCLAGTCNENGFLILTNEIPYTDEMLASRFHMDVGIVQRAMLMFQKLNMIEVVDNAYMVSNWLKYQSGDRLEEIREKNRKRQREYRERQKPLPKKNGNVTRDVTCDVTPSISYSFSKYNNIYNLYNLLEDDNYKDKEYYKSNNILLSAVKDWMSYKDERTPKKSNHYTERGMKSLLSEIKKYHETYGDGPVVETINHTIAGQWQGIVWDWMEKKFKKTEKKTEEHPRSDRPSRWASCPDDTWQKLKPFAHDDGSFDWSRFNPDVLTDEDRAWMRSNDM